MPSSKDRVNLSNVELLDAFPDPALFLDSRYRVVRANRAFYEGFRVSAGQMEKASIYELFGGVWDVPELRGLLEKAAVLEEANESLEMECTVPEIGTCSLHFRARSLATKPSGGRTLVVITGRDRQRESDKDHRLTNEDLKDFVENATVPLHWVSSDGTILWANQAELDFLGYSREEYIGHPLAEFHADPEVFEDILHRLTQGKELRDYRARLRKKDGTIRYVSINSNVYWKNGKFIHTRCFTRDVTDRQRAESRLAAEHAVTRILAEARDIEEAAPKILDSIMTSLEVELGELWHLDFQESRMRCSLTARKSGKQPSSFELHTRRVAFPYNEGLPGCVWATRAPVWVADLVEDPSFTRAELAAKDGLHSGMAFPIQTGESFFGVMAFYSRHRMEPDPPMLEMMAAIGTEMGQFIHRRRAEEQARSEHDFRQAIETCMAAGVSACDLEGRQIYMNPAFIRMLGWSEAELVGKTPPYVYWPPEELDSINDAFRKTLEGKAPPEGFELRFQRRNGERFDVLVAVTSLTKGDGTRSGWLASVTDISHRKRVEKGLKVLALASEVLSSSLDYEKTLHAIARLAIEHVADWCTVDILEDDLLKRVVVAHRDPAKVGLARRLQREYPIDRNSERGPAAVARTGRAEHLSEIPEDLLEKSARGAKHLAVLQSLGLKSYLCVPLMARGRILGTIALASAESERRYDETDLRFAEELARRAAIALDNAQLYESAQREIAERKRVEKALRESEERLKLAMDAARMGAWQWDVATSKVTWSPGLERIHGRAPGSFAGTFESVMEDIHPDDVEHFQRTILQAREKRQDLHFEYRILFPDGSTRWLEAHGKLELDADGTPLRLRGMCMDITDRKRAEQISREIESSRALAAGLLRGQEEERRRLARDLHDDVCQRIAATAMQLEKLTPNLSSSPEPLEGIEAVRKQLEELTEDVRRLSHDLHPSLLEYLGLEDALRTECESFSTREGIEVEFLSEDGVPNDIPQEVAVALYRITQESLRNIRKHAKAARATVALEGSRSGLCLRVQDEGVGFELEGSRAGAGLGLVSMRERVRALQGTFEVVSRSGGGTTIEVQVPLDRKPDSVAGR